MSPFSMGDNACKFLDALSTFASLFQHGGRPLGYLTEKEYLKIERLKGLIKQRTASKAIKKAVDGYLCALSKLRSLEEEFEKIHQSSYTSAFEVQQLIRDLLM